MPRPDGPQFDPEKLTPENIIGRLTPEDESRLRYNELLDRTMTPERMQAGVEALSRGKNPITRNTDWESVSPLHDLDYTRVSRDELEVSLLSPDAAAKWKAQRAFKDEVPRFLERHNMTNRFMQSSPLRGRTEHRPQDVKSWVDVNEANRLMEHTPELKQLYIDTMRAHGF